MDADVPVKVVKVPPAPTAVVSRGKKTRKTTCYCAGDPRAVFVMAVGNPPLTIDHPHLYRPLESPANHYIHGCAGDAGGTSLCLLGRLSFPSSRSPAAHGSFKAPSNVLVA